MFRPAKNLPVGNQDYFSYVIFNNQTIAIGDALVAGTASSSSNVYGAGTTSVAAAGLQNVSKILGVCVGFLPINQTGGTAATQELASFVAPGTNSDSGGAAVRAKFIPARLVDLWVADLNVASATTTGSGGAGYFTMYGTNGSLLESSYIPSNTSIATYTASTLTFASFGSANNYGTGSFYSTSQVVGVFNLYV